MPRLLRATLDEATVDEAFAELFNTIWHQGTVYEATAPAVPFLVALIVDRSVAQRSRVTALHLLRCVVTGSSYLAVHRPTFREMGWKLIDAVTPFVDSTGSPLVRLVAIVARAQFELTSPRPIDAERLERDWDEHADTWRSGPWGAEEGWDDPLGLLPPVSP